jgi:iron(III) transport system ATP-binding protein
VNSIDAVALQAISKRLGSTRVLDDLDLTSPAAAITAVLGASGSGKTTLLRVIAGLERVDHGRVTVAGRVVDDGRRVVDARHRGIGYVPQDAALFPHLTVRANIGFGLRRSDREHVGELLEMIGLDGYADRHPHQLSGGQQQRVALARALAIRPTLVLLDEPFGALDAALREELRRDVTRVLAQTRTAAILVTHDQDEALALADHIALLSDARIIAHGRPDELYRRPPSVAAAQTLGAANLLAAEVGRSIARCAIGEIVLDGGTDFSGAATLLLRPEQLRLTTDGPGVEARVVRIEHHGYDAVVELEVPNAGRLTARIPADAAFQAGQAVRVFAEGRGHAWPLAGERAVG